METGPAVILLLIAGAVIGVIMACSNDKAISILGIVLFVVCAGAILVIFLSAWILLFIVGGFLAYATNS